MTARSLKGGWKGISKEERNIREANGPDWRGKAVSNRNNLGFYSQSIGVMSFDFILKGLL